MISREDIWTVPRLERWLENGQRLKALRATGGVYGEGKIVGFCEHPQVLIQRKDGSKFWWRMDMCLSEDA